MKVQSIESRTNPLLKEIRSLHERSGREKRGRFLLEGAKLVLEAYAKDLPIEAVVASRSYLENGISDELSQHLQSVVVVEDRLFSELATTTTSPGILAVAEMPFESLEALPETLKKLSQNKASRIVLLDGIQDPGNLGTIIRASLAFNVAALILLKGTADATNPKVVRSAMGSLFALPVYQEADAQWTLKSIKDAGFTVVALDVDGDMELNDLPADNPLALIFGNEGQGSKSGILNNCDHLVRINMESNCESLNVAVCAGIVLNHVYRESGRNKN